MLLVTVVTGFFDASRAIAGYGPASSVVQKVARNVCCSCAAHRRHPPPRGGRRRRGCRRRAQRGLVGVGLDLAQRDRSPRPRSRQPTGRCRRSPSTPGSTARGRSRRRTRADRPRRCRRSRGATPGPVRGAAAAPRPRGRAGRPSTRRGARRPTGPSRRPCRSREGRGSHLAVDLERVLTQLVHDLAGLLGARRDLRGALQRARARSVPAATEMSSGSTNLAAHRESRRTA